MDSARSRCFKQANIKEKIALDRDSLLSGLRPLLLVPQGVFNAAGRR